MALTDAERAKAYRQRRRGSGDAPATLEAVAELALSLARSVDKLADVVSALAVLVDRMSVTAVTSRTITDRHGDVAEPARADTISGSLSLEDQDLTKHPRALDPREETVTAVTSRTVTEPETRAPTAPPCVSHGTPERRPTNTSADGCMGYAVASWVDRIRSYTGKPFTAPRGGSQELVKLIDAMVEHCPDVKAREAWARSQGEAFARAWRGALHAHSFVDYLNTPKAGVPVAPVTPEAVRKERKRRRLEALEAERTGTAAPPQALLDLLGIRKASASPPPVEEKAVGE